MNPVATVTTVGLGATIAVLAATVLAARAVSVFIDSAICAATDDLSLDDED
jgi:hypothetical protein